MTLSEFYFLHGEKTISIARRRRCDNATNEACAVANPEYRSML